MLFRGIGIRDISVIEQVSIKKMLSVLKIITPKQKHYDSLEVDERLLSLSISVSSTTAKPVVVPEWIFESDSLGGGFAPQKLPKMFSKFF